MEYLVDNIPYYVKSDDRLKLIKISNSEYVKYRNTLKSLLGNNKNNIMGGTSLMGSSPISVERNGNLIRRNFKLFNNVFFRYCYH